MLQPHRNQLVLVLALVLSLTLMGLSREHREAIAHFCQTALFSTGQWLFSRVVRYARSEEKARHLLAENVRLALENMQLSEAAEENRRLRKALQFPQRGEFKVLVPAEVIGRDPDHMYDTLVISAGTSSGVEPGQPVVTTQGLVGHVIHAAGRHSTVQLIMRSRVSAVVQRGRAHGVVSWLPGGRFELRYVDASSDIAAGDEVVTSGLGGRFPKGIKVGHVIEVRAQERDPLFKAVFMQSSVDFWDLEEVFVMGSGLAN